MDEKEILATVERTIRSIPGVVDMMFLNPEMREEVTRLEMLAEKNGACGGLMPFVNKGVWEALARQVSLVVVGNAHMILDNDGLLYMMDQKGQVLGEYVPPGKRREVMKKDSEAHFLSDDFILHPGVEISGEPYFLIAEVSFPYLDGIDGVTRVTSGSISTLSDDLVRNVMGYTGPKTWTHLVGFDIRSA